MGVSRPHDAARLIKSTARNASGFLWYYIALREVNQGFRGTCPTR